MSDDLQRFRGRWVALARGDDHVVAAAPSLEQLQTELERLPSLAVLIRRIPGANDPIFVGLG